MEVWKILKVAKEQFKRGGKRSPKEVLEIAVAALGVGGCCVNVAATLKEGACMPQLTISIQES